MTKETETTIINQVKEMEASSGATLEIDLVEVSALANRAKLIKDPKTEDDFLQVKEIRQELGKYRKTVSDFFMSARRGFNQKAKEVIEIEKETLAVFTPEEERLKAFEKAEKDRLVKEARMEALPARKERLEAMGGGDTLHDVFEGSFDDFLLSMEDADFEIYIVQRQADKNEADRIALEEAKVVLEAEAKEKQDALDAEKAKQDAIEKARQEERELAEKSLQVEKERMENEAKEAKERAEREKAESEARRVREESEAEERRIAVIKAEEDEKQRIIKEGIEKINAEEKAKKEKEADKQYQAWLKENGYNAETSGQFKVEDEGGTIYLYELISTYAKD